MSKDYFSMAFCLVTTEENAVPADGCHHALFVQSGLRLSGSLPACFKRGFTAGWASRCLLKQEKVHLFQKVTASYAFYSSLTRS